MGFSNDVIWKTWSNLQLYAYYLGIKLIEMIRGIRARLKK